MSAPGHHSMDPDRGPMSDRAPWIDADVWEAAVTQTRAAHDPGGRWELIGPEDCPILYRRTLVARDSFKVLVHRFQPDASDKDPHDHPRAFLTVVLRGGYDDIQPDGTIDRLRAPTVRRRPADHAHITRVHSDGALTVVVMGRLRRPWGFVRDGWWWPWRMYEQLFGLNWRCDTDEGGTMAEIDELELTTLSVKPGDVIIGRIDRHEARGMDQLRMDEIVALLKKRFPDNMVVLTTEGLTIGTLDVDAMERKVAELEARIDELAASPLRRVVTPAEDAATS